ncbi:MAG: cytochrome c3 family protein [Blastocatellales bacterium]|nr:cytochrome c3 family protein [Blastocatellales bacterium]
MHSRSSVRKALSAPICALLLVFACLPTGRQAGSARPGDENQCIACHSRASGRAGEVAGLHLKSSHAKQGCQSCHGGDPSQQEKLRAHSGGFISAPDRAETLAMCGRCHSSALREFERSRHFPESRNIPRLDCAECHGTHTVGNPPETFGYVALCTSCHGLEYLPELPEPVTQMLALTDDLQDAVRVAERQNRPLSADFITGRRRLRRNIAEIVHSTDLQSGLPRAPDILRRGESLKAMVK